MRCAYDLKPSMQTSSTYIIVFYVWCLFPRRQRFVVLSLLLLVDTNKARRVTTARRPFLREIFPPTEQSSFCLGFCEDDCITTAHGVIMSFARKTNNLRRESREKGGRLFRRFLSRADGKKINTTYSLFELEEHMLEAEIIQLITFAAALHVCNNLYYVTND